MTVSPENDSRINGSPHINAPIGYLSVLLPMRMPLLELWSDVNPLVFCLVYKIPFDYFNFFKLRNVHFRISLSILIN